MAPAQKHRENLVAASLALFQRQGYAATGLAEILAESGSPKGSFYYYFPGGKEAVAAAALVEVTSRIAAGAEQLWAAYPNPADLLRAHAGMMAESMRNSGFRAGCPIATMALEAAPQSPRLTTASGEAFDAWTEGLGRGLRRAGLPADRAASIAEFIIASFEGALLLARVRRSTEPILRAAEELGGVVARALEQERRV